MSEQSENKSDNKNIHKILLLLALLGGAALICYKKPELLKLRFPTKTEAPVIENNITEPPVQVTIEPIKESSSNFRYLMYMVYNNPGLIFSVISSIQSMRNYKEIMGLLNAIVNYANRIQMNVNNLRDSVNNLRNPIVNNPNNVNNEIIENNVIQNNDQFIEQNVIRKGDRQNSKIDEKSFSRKSDKSIGGKKKIELKDLNKFIVDKFKNHGAYNKDSLNIPKAHTFSFDLDNKQKLILSQFENFKFDTKIKNFNADLRSNPDIVTNVLEYLKENVTLRNLNLNEYLNEMITEANIIINNTDIEGGPMERFIRLQVLLTQDDILDSIINHLNKIDNDNELELTIDNNTKILFDRMTGLIEYLESLYFELNVIVTLLRDFYSQDPEIVYNELHFTATLYNVPFITRETFLDNYHSIAVYYNINLSENNIENALGRIRMLHYTNRNNIDYRELINIFYKKNQHNINILFDEVREELLNVLNKK